MNIDETYNIHKKINCIFPHFKSKLLCKKGLHNYRLRSYIEYIPITREEFNPSLKYRKSVLIEYQKKWVTYYKCYCCGKEIR